MTIASEDSHTCGNQEEAVCHAPRARTCVHAQATLTHAAYLVGSCRPIFVLDGNAKGLRRNRCWRCLARYHRAGAAIFPRYPESCLDRG